MENKMVTEIQKIRKVEIDTKNSEEENTDSNNEKQKETKLSKSEIQDIKKFLIEEYGVDEKCLEIN